MAVTFNKTINAYIANIGGKQIAYSVNKYGDLAKKLANKSLKTKQRHKNDIDIITDDIAHLHIYHKPTDSIFTVIIDVEDIEKIQKYKWYINVPQNAKTFYVASNKIGKLHRFIMNVTDPSDIIDHINHNGLDNRKNNLRIVNTSINKKNGTLFKNNTSGYKGISIEKKSIKAYWMENGRLKAKRFSTKKYDNALELAINTRKQKEKECGYAI